MPRVMLSPDPEVNTGGDAAWFGVLTWIEPEDNVKRNRARLVRVSSMKVLGTLLTALLV